MTEYRSPYAKTMVLLHATHLLDFLRTWKIAKNMRLSLEGTKYQSADGLYVHVVSRSRDCLIRTCTELRLPVPAIREPPSPPFSEAVGDEYLKHLLDQWIYPLRDVVEQQLRQPSQPKPLDTTPPITAVLEHAVMHTLRHKFELSELIITQALR